MKYGMEVWTIWKEKYEHDFWKSMDYLERKI